MKTIKQFADWLRAFNSWKNESNQCKFCGTNGAHYCPNDIAKD